jgi:TRAP-type C4-dicarboxylate transport system permease small subunit
VPCLILRDAAKEAAPQDEGIVPVLPSLEILSMSIADKLVLQRQRHLKWRSFDRLELILMILCGVLCFGFSLSVTADIVTRTMGRPWLWLQEVTSTLFIYAIFVGTAVATRRNDHLYLTAISDAMHGTPRLIVEIIIRVVVLGVALCLIWFGYINYLRGFGSFRLPSGTPIASLYAAIPLSGVLIALFAIEQLVNGIIKGFDHPEPPEQDLPISPVDTSVQPRVGL